MYNETNAGWQKYEGNPVLGRDLGTCFDISVMKEENRYMMYFSWRPKRSVAMVESCNGIDWGQPVILIGPREETGWEEEINRPVVLKKDGKYLMWYTGQMKPGLPEGTSWIGYAESNDGLNWSRKDEPVLKFEYSWEKNSVMCPHVIWDKESQLFRMWYSGGEQYEPDAIGYATSQDGIHWVKHPDNPIFLSDPSSPWEKEKVTACQVIKHRDWYVMFYVGFEDVATARIGIARSKNGVTDWERFRSNPVISPGKDKWDGDACYKPYVIFDGGKWMLWYNGRRGSVEQIGMAIHEHENLWL